MNAKLISSLRDTADCLDSGDYAIDCFYNSKTSCGILVQDILGISQNQLEYQSIRGLVGYDWEDILVRYWPVRGIPTHSLLLQLHNVGLTRSDLLDLHCLGNEKVRSKCDFGTSWLGLKKARPNPCNKWHVSMYLRAWANLLEEQGRDDVVPSKASQPSINGVS